MVAFWKDKTRPPVRNRVKEEEVEEKQSRRSAEKQLAKRTKTLGRAASKIRTHILVAKGSY